MPCAAYAQPSHPGPMVATLPCATAPLRVPTWVALPLVETASRPLGSEQEERRSSAAKCTVDGAAQFFGGDRFGDDGLTANRVSGISFAFPGDGGEEDDLDVA